MIIVIILEFINTETKCSEGVNISLVICHQNQDPTSIQTQFQLSHSNNTPTHSRNRITALMNYPTQQSHVQIKYQDQHFVSVVTVFSTGE